MRRGLLPDDRELLGEMVTDICFRNARGYFGLGQGHETVKQTSL